MSTEQVEHEKPVPLDEKPQKLESQTLALQLDYGEQHVRYRKKWWQLWIPKDPPPPPRDSLDDAPEIPLSSANILSVLTYTWATPLMKLGYQRTLQASDLWAIDSSRSAATLSTCLDEAWEKRAAEAEKWNQALRNGEIAPRAFRKLTWYLRAIISGGHFKESISLYESSWREKGGLKKPSLAFALNDTLGRFFWSGGIVKVFGDVSQLMGPLLVKAIINFEKGRAAAKSRGEPAPGVGRGIGMAIGLFCIIILTSVLQHQFFWRSMATGVLARTALISSIYKRGVSLTGKSRARLSNSKLVNHISTDVSRIDAAAQWFHAAWTAPIQVLICLVILLVQIGPAALAGFALFLFMAPISGKIASHQFKIRRKSMVFTDQRSKSILEALGGMRIVKYFSYEIPFLKRINEVRREELEGIRKICNAMSASVAFAYSTPALAATFSLLVYTKVEPEFDVAVIFASLSLFQLLRQPMMLLPRALSAISDSRNAFKRLTAVFEAELMPEQAFAIDKDQDWALFVQAASFEWEGNPDEETSSKPFQVQDITMTIPRGTLTAIVGRVGSGKSSLLQGLIGEMRMLSGKVVFGEDIAYCPQVAWIQNASLRDNILFGLPYDEDRYWKVLDDSCLLPDLALLADGDLTEIGEKGINLSGGQKQRVNIARALYSDADILILDDPLSAVDAHVGKSLFHNAVLASVRSQGKTVILVTHALHFLSSCDDIYVMENGRVKEHGSYQDLITKEGEIARLGLEFGGTNDAESTSEKSSMTVRYDSVDQEKQRSNEKRLLAAGTGKLEGRLIVKEKRTTGSVPLQVYWKYLSAGQGYMTLPILLLSIILMQGSQIMNTYILVWWQANTFHRDFSFYQGLYAGLGIAQAIFTFTLGIIMDTISYFVSRNLHLESIRNIFYAPMSFFDTTPVGRIMGVFGKDIDSIDNQLPISMRLLALTLSGVLGSVVIITVVEHYFIIVVVVVTLGYQHFQSYYRASAREVKRLDAMLRSLLYAHFSESLTGLPTIRSYKELPRFLRENKYYIDLENRALFLTVTNQRWLAVRLDFCGAIMVLAVAIFAVVGTSSASAAQVGLVLTYTTSLTQLCGLLTRQTADVENYMNSVERVVHYSRRDLIEQEAPHEIPENKPAENWPLQGSIEFKDVRMSYRPGLPDVLHGISLLIQGGEKIGVVGRTGAGKSSLALTLLRIVEYSGTITIDNVDIAKIGLRDLRQKVSIIPQDPQIFSGTVRTALDPFNLYDDARLWDALRRSSLVDSMALDERGSRALLTLDTVIEPEGANLSVGERSLLSLARALVRDSRVVILDEATASVDLETDKKIQQTIATEFRNRTLLCIAHRLRTILSYDRILVLDGGHVAEFDSPSKLYQREGGIFRNLCERSNIVLRDIISAV